MPCKDTEYLKDPLDCALQDLAGAMVGMIDQQTWDTWVQDFLVDPNAPQTSGVVLWSRPRPSMWVDIWEATWIGSGSPVMVGLALFILITGYKLRAQFEIWGVVEAGPQNSGNLKLGFIGALLAYPVAILGLLLANGMAEVLLPTGGAACADTAAGCFPAVMTAMFAETVSSAATFVINPLSSILGFFGVAIITVCVFIWKLMLVARGILVPFYVYLFPILIATQYTGLPVVSDLAQSLLSRYISVLLIPIVPALLTRVYFVAFGTEATDSILLSAVFMVLMVYLTWKLFSSAAPVASRAIKGGVGVGLAGGVLATGGSGFAATNMLRGRYLSGAIYATTPDFDFTPAEDETRRD